MLVGLPAQRQVELDGREDRRAHEDLGLGRKGNRHPGEFVQVKVLHVLAVYMVPRSAKVPKESNGRCSRHRDGHPLQDTDARRLIPESASIRPRLGRAVLRP